MARALWLGMTAAVVLLSTSGCSRNAGDVNMEDDKARIEEVIRASIGWAKTKDTDLLYRSFAQDEDLFWFAPEKAGTVHGFQSFKKTVENVFLNEAFKAIRFEIRDLRIHLSRSGDVAWYSCMLDDENEWNGQPASWIDVRWTGVLEKREGTWVIVQMHFSHGTGADPE